MKRYVCTISYDGSAYEGWQSQKRGTSIQETIERVVEHIAGVKTNVMASGRTDAGVSASAQVIMFDTEREMPARKWMGALNGFLPKDIHVIDCQEKNMCFHVRYNVRWKRYVYRIHMGMYDVFSRNTAYQCPIPLDVDAMKQALQYLIGTHDFTSFNSSPLEEYPDQVRTIFDIQLHQDGNDIAIEYRGKGFLRYMVRMMSSALIEVGKHKYPVEYIQELLDAKSKKVPHKNAPACGLRLEEVNYFEIIALCENGMIREYLHDDELPEGYTIDTLEKMVKDKEDTRYYVMTTRHSQEQLGYFEVKNQNTTLYLYQEESRKIADELEPQVQLWMKENQLEGDYQVRSKKD